MLIVFFVILICYQLILANNIIEGLTTYQAYDPSNNTILEQQNAGNISYLKQRLDEIQGLSQEVQDISGNVVSLQTQVNGLVSAQQNYATQMTGGTAPDITGATNSETISS